MSRNAPAGRSGLQAGRRPHLSGGRRSGLQAALERLQAARDADAAGILALADIAVASQLQLAALGGTLQGMLELARAQDTRLAAIEQALIGLAEAVRERQAEPASTAAEK